MPGRFWAFSRTELLWSSPAGSHLSCPSPYLGVLRIDWSHRLLEIPWRGRRGAVGSHLTWLSRCTHVSVGQEIPMSPPKPGAKPGNASSRCAGPRGGTRPAGTACSLPPGAAWCALLQGDLSLS